MSDETGLGASGVKVEFFIIVQFFLLKILFKLQVVRGVLILSFEQIIMEFVDSSYELFLLITTVGFWVVLGVSLCFSMNELTLYIYASIYAVSFFALYSLCEWFPFLAPLLKGLVVVIGVLFIIQFVQCLIQ